MKKIIWLFFLCARTFLSAKAQTEECTTFRNVFNFFWKIDSFGVDGYRPSIIDNMEEDNFLIDRDSAAVVALLGNPFYIYKEDSTVKMAYVCYAVPTTGNAALRTYKDILLLEVFVVCFKKSICFDTYRQEFINEDEQISSWNERFRNYMRAR